MDSGILRAWAQLARPVIRSMRELPIRVRTLRPGQGPRVVFLPAYGREGAALLRIYNVATVLRARGWDVHVLHWKFTLAQRHRWLSALRPDIVVMQGTRHPLNRPALYDGHRIVLDLDDADFHLAHLAPSVREAMPQVACVLAGSEYIAEWCRGAGAREVHVVWTGAPVSRRPRPAQDGRAPVVAWTQTRPMTYRHEAALVRRIMRQVAARHPGTVLRLYDRRPGDDPAFAQSFEAPGLTVEWRAQAGYETFLGSLDDVALGLAPLVPEDPFCRAKSFGKLLAYLDRHVPVVASDFGEPRAFFTRATGALCGSEEDWVAAVSGLLSDAAARQAMADAGFAAFRSRLSVDAAANRVAEVLGKLPGSDRPEPIPRAAVLG